MKPRLITAFASLLPDGGLPQEIVYLPEGEHTITPFVDGKPQKIAPKDEAVKPQALAFLEANEALGTQYLEALPKKHEGLAAPIIRAGATAPHAPHARVPDFDHRFLTTREPMPGAKSR